LDVLHDLTRRLAQAAGIGRPVPITVVNDMTVNALTLSGGRIVVFRGLIARADDADEVAAVLGHEMGHVARYDPEAALLRELGFSAVLSMVGHGDASGLRYGRNLLSLSYSREAETAADEAALRYLATAGMNPAGLARFFAVLDRLQGGADAAVIPWLATHPPTALRRQRAAIAASGGPAMDDADWWAVRRVCR